MDVLKLKEGLRVSGFVVGESDKLFAFWGPDGQEYGVPAINRLKALRGLYRRKAWVTVTIGAAVEFKPGTRLWDATVTVSDPPKGARGRLRRSRHRWTGRNVLASHLSTEERLRLEVVNGR